MLVKVVVVVFFFAFYHKQVISELVRKCRPITIALSNSSARSNFIRKEMMFICHFHIVSN